MPHHNPFDGITDLFTEFGRMREVGTRGEAPAAEHRQRTHASAWVPPTDIFAQGDRLVIRMELAGVDPDDVDLRFANGVLTVSGNRRSEFGDVDGDGQEDEPTTFYVRERFYGEFRRAFTLPEGTQHEQINAGFDDGLVEITVSGVVGRTDSARIELRDRSRAASTRRVD